MSSGYFAEINEWRLTLNFGFDVTVRHAVRISMFFSLCCVCGNAEPSHMTVGPNTESFVLRTESCDASGANGDGP